MNDQKFFLPSKVYVGWTGIIICWSNNITPSGLNKTFKTKLTLGLAKTSNMAHKLINTNIQFFYFTINNQSVLKNEFYRLLIDGWPLLLNFFGVFCPSQCNFKLYAVLGKGLLTCYSFFASNSLSCQNVMKQVIILLKQVSTGKGYSGPLDALLCV